MIVVVRCVVVVSTLLLKSLEYRRRLNNYVACAGFFCACGGACAGFFCACGGACAGFLVIWGAFLYARVVSLIENSVSFRGKKMRNLRSPLLLLSSPRKISNFRSSIFTFSDNTLEMWFFSILLLFVCCLLFVVVVVVWCWCCWCCFYYCVVTSFFLHFWLVKPTPSLLLQKSHAHTKKTGHTTRIKRRRITILLINGNAHAHKRRNWQHANARRRRRSR